MQAQTGAQIMVQTCGRGDVQACPAAASEGSRAAVQPTSAMLANTLKRKGKRMTRPD
jgi:hypothetical protein